MKARLCLLLLPAVLALPACGDPTLQAPAPLEVSFMPLDGAVGVPASVTPQVVFTGEVDAATVSAASALLASAAPDVSGGCADVVYEDVEASPALDTEQPQILEIPPAAAAGADILVLDTCYRLTLTTALKGVELGPLQDMGLPERPGIGAEAFFQTADLP